jgi:hypothetical protein
MIARGLLLLLGGYRRFISPLLGRHCRFIPSCSEYAMLAVDEWGPWRGSYLAMRRLMRCHPFHPAGVDFPPARTKVHG